MRCLRWVERALAGAVQPGVWNDHCSQRRVPRTMHVLCPVCVSQSTPCPLLYAFLETLSSMGGQAAVQKYGEGPTSAHLIRTTITRCVSHPRQEIEPVPCAVAPRVGGRAVPFA
jgi:hypothetical protein